MFAFQLFFLLPLGISTAHSIYMKHFNNDYKDLLLKTIAFLEKNSKIEIVVLVRARSANYTDISLWWGIAGALVALAFVIFYPGLIFGDYLLFLIPVMTFVLFTVLSFIPALKRLFLSRERRSKQVECYARALFQKAGIHRTESQTGMLIYISVFEQQVFLLPDRGVKTAIPPEDWQKIESDVQSIFEMPNPAEKFIKILSDCQAVFTEYIPPVANDINELPDDLEVDL